MMGYWVTDDVGNDVSLDNALQALGYTQPEQAAAAADAAALRARVAELGADAEDAAHKLRVACAERDWARNARDSAARTVDILRNELAATSRQLDKAIANVQQLDAAKQRAELRAADMADTIKAQAATIAKLTAERDELRTQLANLAGAVQSLLKDKEQLIAQLNDANERLKPFVTW